MQKGNGQTLYESWNKICWARIKFHAGHFSGFILSHPGVFEIPEKGHNAPMFCSVPLTLKDILPLNLEALFCFPGNHKKAILKSGTVCYRLDTPRHQFRTASYHPFS